MGDIVSNSKFALCWQMTRVSTWEPSRVKFLIANIEKLNASETLTSKLSEWFPCKKINVVLGLSHAAGVCSKLVEGETRLYMTARGSNVEHLTSTKLNTWRDYYNHFKKEEEV